MDIKRLAALVGFNLVATLAFGQAAVPPSGDQVPHSRAQTSPDVIVTAIPHRDYSVKTAPPGAFRAETLYSEQASANAQHFGRCLKAKDEQMLRRLVDGLPNRSNRVEALDYLVRANLACYPESNAASLSATTFYGDCNPRGQFKPVFDPVYHRVIGVEPVDTVCQAFFDRGAVVERVLALYTPGLSLTAAQLNDPAVVARYLVREKRFDGARSGGERRYALTVGCLVEGHPEISIAMLQTQAGSAREADVGAALIGLTPACAGGATRIEVDPSQFRVFVADAVYSWAVAVRGGTSLIPAG